MKSDLHQKIYLKNMINFSAEFFEFKPFVFYGSLLGIIREKNIIKNDDDIDFFVSFELKKKILDRLSNSKKFKINNFISNEFFTQIAFVDQGIKVFIDLYFYLDPKDKDYIIDRHNFFGDIKDLNKSLHIPKKLIFPLIENNNHNYLLTPQSPEKLCEFIYGSNWKTPLKKNIRYKMIINDYKPKLKKITYLSGLIRSLKKKLKEIYKNSF